MGMRSWALKISRKALYLQNSENWVPQNLSTIYTVQWTLQIADTLGHRPLSVIEGMSFIGVFWLSTSHWSKLTLLIIIIAKKHWYDTNQVKAVPTWDTYSSNKLQVTDTVLYESYRCAWAT